MSIYDYTVKCLVAKSQQQLKRYIRQKLKDEFTDQLQLSTEVGKINKIVKDKLKQIKSNYYRTVYDWLIDQKKIPEQDVDKIINSIKQYQVIQRNYRQCPKFSVFKKYSDLAQFIQNYKKQNSSYQFQRLRNQAKNSPLPFNKMFSNGKYDVYIIKSGQWDVFNKLYGNNNGSAQGGLIATTSWCVALDEYYFNDYEPPYYLFVDKSNNPQALLHVNSHQFKDVNDDVYIHDNKEVCQLAIDIIKHREGDFQEDFEVLVQYFSQQDKQQYIDYLIKYDSSLLYWKIRNDTLPMLNEKQTYDLINQSIERNDLSGIKMFVENGFLTITNQLSRKLSNQQLVSQNYKELFDLINYNICQQLSEQLFDKIIQDSINSKKYMNLSCILKQKTLSDSVRKQIIQRFLYQGDANALSKLYLFDYDFTAQLKRKQIQKYIDLLIQNNNLHDLILFVHNINNFDYLSKQQEQWLFKQLAKNHDWVELSSFKKVFNIQFSLEEQNLFVESAVKDKKAYDVMVGLQKQILNKIDSQTISKVVDCLLQQQKFHVVLTYANSKTIKLNDQQCKKIKQHYLIRNLDANIMVSIQRGTITPLTKQQQQKFFNKTIQQFPKHFGVLCDAHSKGFKLTKQQKVKIFLMLINIQHYSSRDIIHFDYLHVMQFSEAKQLLLDAIINNGIDGLQDYIKAGLIEKPSQSQYKQYLQNINKKPNTKTSKKLVKIAKLIYVSNNKKICI